MHSATADGDSRACACANFSAERDTAANVLDGCNADSNRDSCSRADTLPDAYTNTRGDRLPGACTNARDNRNSIRYRYSRPYADSGTYRGPHTHSDPHTNSGGAALRSRGRRGAAAI